MILGEHLEKIEWKVILYERRQVGSNNKGRVLRVSFLTYPITSKAGLPEAFARCFLKDRHN